MENLPKIDMHVHSDFSDGTFSPSEIVSKAKDLDLDLIALTDHNTFSGISEFKKACKKYKVKGIPGIELTTSYKNKEIHVLGYFNINIDFRKKNVSLLKNIIKDYEKSKKEQNEAIIKALEAAGFPVNISGFYKFMKTKTKDENYNRVHIAQYMIHENIIKSLDEAFDNYIGTDNKFFVKKKTISLGKAIRAIQTAGGICIIAHPGEYNFLPDELKLFFDFCKNNGVHGFECFHPSHSNVDILNIIDNALNTIESSSSNYNFLLTMGSDFHGYNKKNKLGKVFDCSLSIEQKTIFELSCLKTYRRLEVLTCI
ncbi:PHP domain-containing protein [Thomasclavelia cocleata]|uniref:PHP domain-containing protein n=1 Tax=Thomasclavelia cocleata TaxID=69824 RepID=UPI00256EF9D0|nr:PHP domain-containing protein [Thomasclavelia cocleata]